MKQSSIINSKIKALQTYFILVKQKGLINIEPNEFLDNIFNSPLGNFLVLTPKEYSISVYDVLEFVKIEYDDIEYLIFKMNF